MTPRQPRQVDLTVWDEVPAFGSRTSQALAYAGLAPADVTEGLRHFGLHPGSKYVYRLLATGDRPNPTYLTIAGLRSVLGISAEWWFDPSLTATRLRELDLRPADRRTQH